MAIIVALALNSGLAFAIGYQLGPNVVDDVLILNTGSYIEFSFADFQITPNNTVYVDVDGVGDFEGIDCVFPYVSSGSITTVGLDWYNLQGVSINNETLTSGTDITDFDSNIVRISITNPDNTNTVNITGNIILRN